MRAHGYQFYPLIAVAALAAATTWLERITRVEGPAPETVLRHDPDTIVNQSHMLSYDRDGILTRVLNADTLLHYPDDGSGELIRPRLQIIKDTRNLYLDADHGVVTKEGDRVDLDGHVRGRRDGLPGQAPMLFQSDTLTVWPDRQTAHSATPSTLQQGNSVVRGSDMQADNLFGNFVVTGSVRATIERHTHRP